MSDGARFALYETRAQAWVAELAPTHLAAIVARHHHYHSSIGPVLGAVALCCVIAALLGARKR